LANDAISIIVPAYHERDNITSLVTQLHQALASRDYELIIVDDDSGDGSVELVRELSAKYPVRIMVRRGRRGLATAVADGLAEARGSIIGVMDADLQHPPEVMTKLVTEITGGADMAIASRYVAGGGCPEWGPVRRLISRGAIFLSHLLLPSTRRIADPVSGCFAFRQETTEGITLRPIGYKILLEVLVRGRARSIVEVPYLFQTRGAGESKLNVRQQTDYLKHLWRLMRAGGELKRFTKFCLVGLSGVGVNMGLLWLLTEFGGLDYRLASPISIEMAIISNFTLNDYFTFPDRRTRGEKSFLMRLAKFNLVSLAGLGINLAVLWLLTETLGIYYLLSNLCGIALATVWNYLVNSLWTWRW